MILKHLRLYGCAPTPLAHYLKALGIFRLIAEQFDPICRGWWQDEHFHLLTLKTKEELEQFFLEEYQPTPMISPWNKGCGFFKANDPGLVPLEQSTAPRFERFRNGITASRKLLDEVSQSDAVIRAIKARSKTNRTFQTPEQRQLLRESFAIQQARRAIMEQLNKEGLSESEKAVFEDELNTIELMLTDADQPPTKAEVNRLKASAGYKRLLNTADRRFKSLKAALIPDCRRQWRGPHAQWLAAAVVIGEDGTPDWPSLLGTGGNDGNLDFTNNFMQRIVELFDVRSERGEARPESAELLQHAMWNAPTNAVSNNSIGQFHPGSAGGANSSTGTAGSPLINSWDFVLMLEGSIMFSAAATKRLAPDEISRASAPFAIRAHAAGHPSSGSEKAQRGEQWMPLWKQPCALLEIKNLFSESRLQLDRHTAARPIDAARAISRLSTARGIESFIRYGYLERNGQSTLAVPLARVSVRQHPLSHLIDDLAQWLDRLQMRARDSHAPARLIHRERVLADTVLAALTQDTPSNPNPLRWQAILAAAVAIEHIQASGTAIDAGPLPPLSPDWIRVVGDDIEVRLALALGSAAAGYTKGGWPSDSVRHHWLPITEERFPKFKITEQRLVKDPRVVAGGRNFLDDCAAVVSRRIIEAERTGTRHLMLNAKRGFGARLGDLTAFIGGEVDLHKLAAFSRAFMALRWDQVDSQHVPDSWRIRENPSPQKSLAETGTAKYEFRSGAVTPDTAWLMLRLVHLPRKLADGREVAVEPAMIRLLQSGDATRAIEIATRRLRSSGIRPPLSTGYADHETCRRWAAAIVFPLNYGSAQQAAQIVDPSLRELGVV